VQDDIVIEGFPDPTDAELKRISELVEKQFNLQLDAECLEARLKLTKQALRNVAERELPEAATSCGVRTFTTNDGLKLKVQDTFRCAQLDDAPDEEGKRPRSERLDALSWLQDHGHGDLAKRVVTVTLGSDSQDTALELIRLIRSHPKGNQFIVDHRRAVPWNSLSSFARGQVRDGYDPPLETLGVSRVAVAKVTRERE
jgi:hypothetical protein